MMIPRSVALMALVLVMPIPILIFLGTPVRHMAKLYPLAFAYSLLLAIPVWLTHWFLFRDWRIGAAQRIIGYGLASAIGHVCVTTFFVPGDPFSTPLKFTMIMFPGAAIGLLFGLIDWAIREPPH